MPTLTTHCDSASHADSTLHVALDLGNKTWCLACAPAVADAPRLRTLPARDLARLQTELATARRHLGPSVDAPVVLCYEAGARWLLAAAGVYGRGNHRAGRGLLEYRGLASQTPREDGSARCHRVAARVVAALGGGAGPVARAACADGGGRRSAACASRARASDAGAHARRESDQGTLGSTRDLPNDAARLAGAAPPCHAVGWPAVAKRAAPAGADHVGPPAPGRAAASRSGARPTGELEHASDPAVAMVRQLLRVRGVGEMSAWLLTMELFSWRRLRNRREVAGILGLTATPQASGDRRRELGIGKSGSALLRGLALELAWCWLRYQPHSALSQWYRTRFAAGGSRQRRIGIVAVARRLMIALWRYVETGQVPAGALLKA